jgi:hypothetical protein
MFLGHIAHHMVLDPRDRQTLLLGTSTGHLGPTVSGPTISACRGRRPVVRRHSHPAIASGAAYLPCSGSPPATLTNPASGMRAVRRRGLFRTDDGGETWDPVTGWNEHQRWETWAEWPEEGTPDGSMLHSMIVDPRDAAHLDIGLSGRGGSRAPTAVPTGSR